MASTVTGGFNIESSYQFSLSEWELFPIPGDFNLRALGTYVSKFVTDPGIPGGIVVNSAGANDGATPHLKAFFVQTYQAENWQVTLSENWISQGRHNNNWVQCVPGSCPVSTLARPTVNDNYVPSVLYINLGGSYDVSDNWEVYLQIDNLLNKNAPPFYANNQQPQDAGVNAQLYDAIGRMFHLGLRVSY